ncbi:MAG: NUDIX domain-containing protein, partial [Gemmatimonadota bacterium]
RLLLQRRGRPRDPFYGHLDAPAGGHVAAGETPAQAAVRELAEEAGAVIQPADLVLLGVLRLVDPAGACARVHQHLFLCPRRFGPAALRPGDEVEALVETGLSDLEDLLEGRVDRIELTPVATRTSAPLRRAEASALAAYSEPIRDTLRRSLVAIRQHFGAGCVDPGLWRPGEPDPAEPST